MSHFGNDQTAREVRRDDAARARRAALSAIMVLFLVLLILLLIAAATDRTDILRLAGVVMPTTFAAASFTPILPGPALAAASVDKSQPEVIRQLAAPSPEVSARLRAYYDRCGGERIFGRPISTLIASGPLTYQWYERARLEYDPRLAGTAFEVQGGRLGAERTAGRALPPGAQVPGGRYFPQTGHSVAGGFRAFWEQNGAVEVLGYPISPEMQETLSDGQVHTVQYFERARLELHPQLAGTPFAIQVGLLGRELYRP